MQSKKNVNPLFRLKKNINCVFSQPSSSNRMARSSHRSVKPFKIKGNNFNVEYGLHTANHLVDNIAVAMVVK